ncbi:DUF1330 domain-containing protein [Pseudaestuariivita atlantica]|uniref:DUF1330 domain-containing protein n=1 Tax=Pseudaestuariivita atlantica TaxID=1317121 RepID=A0A0L1JP86_9RHOB|nr:DUF1330 domain-containing protein [Pseudaestuariivita atlantica]KNG93522.1 hypothetical protein ATO11_09890 [Pseudaestuariivita atlantica]
MARGYVIAQINVTDPQAYPGYVALVGPTVEKFGGAFLVRGGRSESFEGTPPGNRTVVIEFPSYQAAQDWYHSSEYAPVRALRQAASTSVQTIVEGVA